MPKVFISYRYKDQDAKSTVDNWIKQGIGEDISFDDLDEVLFDTKPQIRNGIREKILECHKVLVLVGNNTHNSKWVQYEIQQAQQAVPKIPVIWTQLPDTKGAPPPELSNLPETPFRMVDIQGLIRKA